VNDQNLLVAAMSRCSRRLEGNEPRTRLLFSSRHGLQYLASFRYQMSPRLRSRVIPRLHPSRSRRSGKSVVPR
jgi:hypothetical protein